MSAIPISIPGRAQMPKSASLTNLLSKSCPSPSSSPQTNMSIALKRVVLYGTPFKNKETISQLLQECIQEIDTEKAEKIIRESENKEFATVITCDEKKAFRYCQNLVDNGLLAKIE
jgi:hypothetical protein